MLNFFNIRAGGIYGYYCLQGLTEVNSVDFFASKRLPVIWCVVGGATALIDLNLTHRAHQLSFSLHTHNA